MAEEEKKRSEWYEDGYDVGYGMGLNTDPPERGDSKVGIRAESYGDIAQALRENFTQYETGEHWGPIYEIEDEWDQEEAFDEWEDGFSDGVMKALEERFGPEDS